ncbi:MAG: ATP-binding protein [Thermodesulfobacteriota bacterium]|nr:ATP-binding protein [Thermodesulfobacteriota bacterium]
MINRVLTKEIQQSLLSSPVTALVGPRQCGKTTLANQFFRGKGVHFFDLENPTDLFALEDPMFALEEYRDDLVIIDEAQRMPRLFPVIRVLVDQDRKPGRFLLLGSSTPHLRRQSAESLAGRIITLELTPFLSREVIPEHADLNSYWLRGGFPPSLLSESDIISLQWRINYLRDVVERDLGLLGFQLPPDTMYRFLQMLAHNHGQLWNKAQLARSLDVGATTAGRYLDAISQTLLVRRLQPFHKNLGKRLIKSPKVYIRDTGLLHALLGIANRDQLLGHPVKGNSWEGLVIEQLIGCLPLTWEPYFWRTGGGAEIDLLLVTGNEVKIAVEIKAGLTPKPGRGFYEGCQDLQPQERWVIYPGDRIFPVGKSGVLALPLAEAVKRLTG